jgi:hypothetical protein
VKTTLHLPDDLYREVKATAALAGRSVTSLIEEALRVFIAERVAEGSLPELPISPNQGWVSDEFRASGIDFTHTSDVLSWLDRVEGRLP